jgi:general secretion pathway protein E
VGVGRPGRNCSACSSPKPLHDLIITRISNRDLTEKAVALGMRPLAKSGWLKVAAGLTTIDELVRNLSSNE